MSQIYREDVHIKLFHGGNQINKTKTIWVNNGYEMGIVISNPTRHTRTVNLVIQIEGSCRADTNIEYQIDQNSEKNTKITVQSQCKIFLVEQGITIDDCNVISK